MKKEKLIARNYIEIQKIVEASNPVTHPTIQEERQIDVKVLALFDLYKKSKLTCKIKYKDIPRAYYNPITNAAFAGNINGLIAEFAHCLQMSKYGWMKYYFRGIKDWLRHPYLDRKGYDKNQYHSEGTIEHEAHSIIERELYSEYLLFLEKNKGKF